MALCRSRVMAVWLVTRPTRLPLSAAKPSRARTSIPGATAAGTTGVALPAPDVTDTTPINMSGTAGKVALVIVPEGGGRVEYRYDAERPESRTTRLLVDDALQRAAGRADRVEVRDRHCVFTGCEAPAWWCEVHHVLHWGDGGETCLANSALLCERHHGKVHHGFTIVRDPDGRWHTYRPDGTEILIPEPLRT